MFSTTLFIVGIYWTVKLKHLWMKISKNSAISFLVLCIVLYLIYAWQTLTFSGIEDSGIFSLLSPDGRRYLDEARMFKCPLCLNELKGEYSDELNQYAVTPKMGLSGFLSVVTFGWTPTIYSAYALMLLGVALAGFVKIKLIDCFKISPGAKVFLAIMIVLFPVDYYFTLRFLREPIANDLFIIGLLIIFLHQFKGDNAREFIKTLPMILAALIIWRSQLAAVLGLSSLILLPILWRTSLIILPLLMLALFQMIRASHVLRLALDLNSDLAYNFFRFIIDSREIFAQFDTVAFILPLIISIYAPLDFKDKRVGKYRFNFCVILIVMPWILADLDQIRFIYPAVIWMKAALSILIVHQVRLRFRRKQRANKIGRYSAP